MPFACIYVPDFPVQAVTRAEPELRGAAVALLDGAPPLLRIVAANATALAAGIELGMTKANAAHFTAIALRPRSMALQKSAHAALLDLGWSVSPRLEDAAPDTILLDIAGLSALFGDERNIAAQLASRAAQCGLEVNVTVAAEAEAARVAARGFAGISLLARGEEARQLSVLPVSVLEPSLEAAETLERWGVQRCGALAALPAPELSERLGQEGVRLRALARCEVVRALAIAEPGRGFEEEMDLDDAVEELEPLSFILGRMLDQLCARLVARALAARKLRVRFELQPAFEKAFERRREPLRLKPAAEVFERELRLPMPVRDSKLLLKLLRLRLQTQPPAAPVVKVTLCAEPARPRVTQNGLFQPGLPDPQKLELTLARIASLVGEGNAGSPVLPDTHRPGEFRMQPFRAVQSTPSTRDDAKTSTKTKVAGRAAAGFRVFRPPLPATVHWSNGAPQRCTFQNRTGTVHAASGPWRTSGDWWQENPWQHEDWDVEIVFRGSASSSGKAFAFNGRSSNDDKFSTANKSPVGGKPDHIVYRIFYDALRAGWFVRGIYD
jgi:protein ImuB